MIPALLALFAPPAYLHEELLQFSRAQVGKKVGSGQCASLADVGLRQIGARRRFADAPSEGDYVWGEHVGTVKLTDGRPGYHSVSGGAPAPGDVVQYRDVLVSRRTPTRRYEMRAAHHTAVLERTSDEGRTWHLLEQNSNGRQYVVRSELHWPDLKRGWLRLYRPLAP